MDDKKKLYDGLLGLGFTESELGTFDTFSANLDNPEKNKVFYDALIGSKRVNVEQLGTYDTFSAKTLKKKKIQGLVLPSLSKLLNNLCSMQKSIRQLQRLM